MHAVYINEDNTLQKMPLSFRYTQKIVDPPVNMIYRFAKCCL